MNNTIIFFSLLIIILSTMLVFRISIVLDVLENKLNIVIKIYGIRVLTINFGLLGFYYQINNSKKLKPFNLFDKADAYLAMQIKKSILDKFYYDDICIYTNIGVQNAKYTALIASNLNLLFYYIYLKLSKLNKDTNLTYLNIPNYIGYSLCVSIDLKVFFTIFDLCFSLLLSFFKRGQYVKKTKR